jgi:hypothetical protein
MRVLAVAMALLFVYCIGVQYNDPDPYVWIPIYALPLALSLLAARDRHVFWLSALAGLVYVAAGLWWAPRYAPGYFDNEEAREAGGLVLSGVWMAVLTLHGRRAGRKSPVSS